VLDTQLCSILILNTDNRLSAYRNACPHQGLPLDGAMFDAQSCELTCQWHGFKFVATTGECLTAPQAQLEAFPLRVQDGYVWVRPD
jgi:nitrite reductase/ring-hydroxylating ferredoxin subunit